jgi:hypothetical protein
VHPKAQFVLFAMGHFDWPFTKNHNISLPKQEHFLSIWDYGDIILKYILNAHFAHILPHVIT